MMNTSQLGLVASLQFGILLFTAICVEGNSWHDGDCPGDYYWSRTVRQCKRCSPSCPPGTATLYTCTGLHDVVCGNCSPGTYSDVPDPATADRLCLPCTDCTKLNRLHRKNCTNRHDTKCGQCLPGYTRDASLSFGCERISGDGIDDSDEQDEDESDVPQLDFGDSYEYYDDEDSENSTTTTVIGTIFGLIGAAILVSGMYFLFRRRRRNAQRYSQLKEHCYYDPSDTKTEGVRLCPDPVDV